MEREATSWASLTFLSALFRMAMPEGMMTSGSEEAGEREEEEVGEGGSRDGLGGWAYLQRTCPLPPRSSSACTRASGTQTPHTLNKRETL